MHFKVRDVMSRCAVTQNTVLGWIRSGELAAINVARKPGTKPAWRIPAAALEAFEAARAATPPSSAAPRSRHRRQPAGVIQFYS